MVSYLYVVISISKSLFHIGPVQDRTKILTVITFQNDIFMTVVGHLTSKIGVNLGSERKTSYPRIALKRVLLKG